MTSMTKIITVALVDDHALVRSTLATWLASTDDIRVVTQASSADEALEKIAVSRPDVVLLDIDMPGLLAFEAARTIKARLPETKIIFLSAFLHDHYIEQALAVEASGYLTKGDPPASLAGAIRAVAEGGVSFSAEVQARIVIDASGARLSSGPKTRLATLTGRELEVVRYLARGLSKKEIAQIMRLSVKTVDNHSTSLMSKLDIHDRVELARFAIREGLAEA
jgi:DNA-binding NarL/FixJ family response regulator